METWILGKPAHGTKSHNLRKDLTLEGNINVGVDNEWTLAQYVS